MGGRPNLVEVDDQYLLCEARDERMTSIKILAFPSPTNAREDVKSHPDVFQRHLVRDAFAVGHVSVENDHGCDVERDW